MERFDDSFSSADGSGVRPEGTAMFATLAWALDHEQATLCPDYVGVWWAQALRSVSCASTTLLRERVDVVRDPDGYGDPREDELLEFW